jgi:hypothetical protein
MCFVQRDKERRMDICKLATPCRIVSEVLHFLKKSSDNAGLKL